MTRGPRAPRPDVRLRLRVSRGDVVAVGPGKVDLLEAIERTRSISAAARELGMSYRRAWLLVEEINTSLRKPAVASASGGERGGGSVLTATGRELVSLYRRIESRAATAAASEIARLLALVA